ncbi:MAG: hypothetical protein J6B68_01185 [Lachnospiraceae bacterium]|nr:hypothetical protein [Lachnospiraceae bacterium]
MMVNGVLNSFQNSYGMQQIPSVRQEQLPAQRTEADKELTAAEKDKEIAQKQDNLHNAVLEDKKEAAKPIDLENVSLTFHKEENFDYIGNDSSLDNLDMQKAVSDMKKDQVLQEYQYFVGSAKNLFGEQTPDGMVLLKNETGMV